MDLQSNITLACLFSCQFKAFFFFLLHIPWLLYSHSKEPHAHKHYSHLCYESIDCHLYLPSSLMQKRGNLCSELGWAIRRKWGQCKGLQTRSLVFRVLS
jgi:hypothetical protein